jgi:hypothetical protein
VLEKGHIVREKKEKYIEVTAAQLVLKIKAERMI